MDNIDEKILKIIYEMNSEDLPYDISEFMKDSFLDYLSNLLSGISAIKHNIELYISNINDSSKNVKIIGCDLYSSEANAALVYGMASHYYDLDDGSRFGMIHLGAPIFSALFAEVQNKSVEADKFLKAATIGYEIAVRLACAAQPSHKKSGYHATGTFGCIGASVALAIIRNYSNDEIRNTLSAAVASASGLLEMISNTSELKPFNAGKASQNAIIASSIGKSGLSGPIDSLGGTRGLLTCMADLNSIKNEYLNRNDSKEYYTSFIYRKPYASCRHCHPSVEAALYILRNNLENSNNIDKIDITTYDLAIYGHDHKIIDGTGSAKMSIPYSVAAALVLNDAGIKSLSTKAINNRYIKTLIEKINIYENPEYSAQVPNKRISNVTITLLNGDTFSHQVTFPKGEPENPMTREELIDKFYQLTNYAGIEKQVQNKVVDCIYSTSLSVDKLVKILTNIIIN